MKLIDTSAWIDFFNGTDNQTSDIIDRLLDTEPVMIGDLIYCELLQGFRTDKRYNEVKNSLSNLHRVELAGFDIAEKSALNYRKLRKQGITIRKTLDIIIATFCIENNICLIHKDRDFDLISEHLGLKTMNSSC